MLEPKIINFKELLLIAQIEKDETWLYGEKVGHAVDAKCAEVVARVIEVVLRCAEEWRKNFESVSEDGVSPVAQIHRQFISSCRSSG